MTRCTAVTWLYDQVYRGYLVDLLDALAKHASFTYSLRAVADRQRGSRRPDGTWSGLVGQLIAGVSTETLQLSALEVPVTFDFDP